MRKVKSKHTKPEMFIRRLIYALGYRYRLHKKDLPGKPDIIFGCRKKVIFINGCFWHGHDCKRAALPEANRQKWEDKIIGNKNRDQQNYQELKKLGWKYLVIWECEIKKKNYEQLQSKVIEFIEKD